MWPASRLVLFAYVDVLCVLLVDEPSYFGGADFVLVRPRPRKLPVFRPFNSADKAHARTRTRTSQSWGAGSR